MTRGRKPRPTHLRVIEGNPGKRRLNTAEPQPTAVVLPEAPAWLNAVAKEEWARLSLELFRLRLLTTADTSTLAGYCQSYGRWVQAERAIARMAEKDQLTGGLMIKTSNGNAIQNPLVGTANTAMRDMLRFAAEFGLTPAARARLSLGAEPPRSKFDGLVGGTG